MVLLYGSTGSTLLSNDLNLESGRKNPNQTCIKSAENGHCALLPHFESIFYLSASGQSILLNLSTLLASLVVQSNDEWVENYIFYEVAPCLVHTLLN